MDMPISITTPTPRRQRTRRGVFFIVMTLLGMYGCVNLKRDVPPVDAGMAALAGQSVAVLEHGRRLYLTDCARCHTVLAIRRYTPAQWDQAMPKMIRMTKLDANEGAAVTAYVETVLSMPQVEP